ncbi:MAG: hypothetical protein EZS28_005841 [Streblomastix strix]|uniref:Major facilitator superfamily (MFS) profile domain-containing protein n=1 Tax=Streblomastix strix TaxID=222440 RepID=A0A5J4WUP7_9EUKA|nr:MAG: hypothetical protein EZS28_005841 [Streblomastix strix]
MNAGVSRRIMSLVLSFVIGTWVCIMATPQLFFIDRVGRKKVLVFGSLIQVIGMFILMLSNLIPYLVDNKIQYYMSLPGIILFLSGIEIGIGPLYLVMISEMYPEQYTSAIISFMVTVMQISGLIVTTAYSPLSSKIGDSGVFIITFTLCMFQIIFSIFFVKETKGMYPRSNMNMNQNMDMDANTNTNAEDGSGNGKENKVSQV